VDQVYVSIKHRREQYLDEHSRWVLLSEASLINVRFKWAFNKCRLKQVDLRVRIWMAQFLDGANLDGANLSQLT